MSRAFVKEDAGEGGPRRSYGLPSRDDPGFDAAAAAALLEAARAGETSSAERATGYYCAPTSSVSSNGLRPKVTSGSPSWPSGS